jgi:hypothetical protein
MGVARQRDGAKIGMKLIDIRTRDGSRHFLSLPQSTAWIAVRGHAMRLPQLEILNFVDSEDLQARLEFLFLGHRFLIQGIDRQHHFFVSDPNCSDLIVYQVARHFSQLAEPSNKPLNDASRAEDAAPDHVDHNGQ